MKKRISHKLLVGDECVIEETERRPGGWSHGVVVKVTRGTQGRIRWVRLRFPDHTEKSFIPASLRKVIPYKPPFGSDPSGFTRV